MASYLIVQLENPKEIELGNNDGETVYVVQDDLTAELIERLLDRVAIKPEDDCGLGLRVIES